MEYAIHGSTMQAVVLTLQSGESVITETGGMAWQTGNVKMDTAQCPEGCLADSSASSRASPSS